MHVALNAAGFLPDDETELGVRLQIGEAVDDVDAVRLQPLGPQDVVPLVESRLQLDEHGDLLAGFGRGDEQRNERRIRADAVQRHLDRDDVRVLHRRTKERLDRGERLERVMDQDVLVADLVEDHLGILVGAPEAVRRERRVLQLGTMKSRELRPVAEARDDPAFAGRPRR